ncbi:MAG: hypothetical protein ACO1OO_08980 [Flavisolibacter sp.]
MTRTKLKESDCKTQVTLKRLPWLFTLMLMMIGFSGWGQGTDFRQFANKPAESWINSILQQNNSAYYEGTSTLQRLVLVGIPATSGNQHVLTLSHQASKGTIHAYDFITGYEQAKTDYATITGGPFTGLVINGPAIGPQATAQMVMDLYSGPNSFMANAVPSGDYNAANNPGDNVAAKVAAYDAIVGVNGRKVALYGDASITSAELVLTGYSGGADKYAEYELRWTSASTNVLILMGGHLALGRANPAFTGVNYGPGLGSSAISGGPYHFKLATLDGASLGSQDNQIKGADILIPPPPCTITGGSPAICSGGTTASFSGPAGMDNYAWSISPAGATINGSGQSVTVSSSTPGTYTLKLVTTLDGVSSTATCTAEIVVTELQASDAHNDALCNGGTGTITITFSGGTSPYQVNFNGGGFVTKTSPATYNMVAGTYTWTVRDDLGCTQSGSETIGQPAALVASDGHNDPLCNGGTGTVTITFSGGTSPYQVNFNGGGFVSKTSPATYNVPAGTYTWTVRDNNGCTQSGSETVGQPAALVASDGHNDALCNGGTGTVTITFSGGTSPYQVDFNGGGFVTKTSPATYNVPAGTYTWTVRDNNGCTQSGSETVGQPAALVASDGHNDALCNGGTGTVTITFSGGTSPYQVNFNGGGYVTKTSPATYNVPAGTYTWTVRDNNGCTQSGSETVGQPAALVASDAHNDASCNGGTGTVTITFSGGTSPYQVDFNGGGYVTKTSPATYNVPAGTYTWTVRDANGCMQSGSETVGQPSTLVASDAHNDALCNGGTGTVTITFSGGTSPYQVNFNGGGYVTKTSPATYNVVAGTYTWTVKDAGGCTQSGSETVGQPAALVASDGHNDPLCNGGTGTVTITFSGGTSPYQVNFNGGGFVTKTSPATYNVPAGTYTWTVRDNNGCTQSGSETVGQPSALVATDGHNDALCNGGTGTVTITFSGGTSPYQVTFNGGGFATKTSPATYNVPAGTYTWTVRDNNGCTQSGSETVGQPDAAVGGTVNNVTHTCDQTSAAATPPYSFSGSVSVTGIVGSVVRWESSPDGGTWTTVYTGNSTTYNYTGLLNDTYFRAIIQNGPCPEVESEAGLVTIPNCIPRGETHCSYTQGFYGGKGKACDGTASGIPVIDFTNTLIGDGITVGVLGARSVTIPSGGATDLNKIMPGGGTARQLDYDGDVTVGVDYSTYYGTGRIKNVLLSQTITLALNVRIGDGTLADYVLPADGLLVTYPLTTCGGVSTGTSSTYTIPMSVINYLGAGATVEDLLNLANEVLAYGSTGGRPSASNVNAAVDAINRGWDECRSTTMPSAPMGSARYMVSAPQIHANKLTATAAPNPFFDKVRFTISTPVDGNVQLEVVNLLGQRVSSVYSGFMKANTTQVIDYNVPASAPQNLIYIIRSGNEQVTGKLLRANR